MRGQAALFLQVPDPVLQRVLDRRRLMGECDAPIHISLLKQFCGKRRPGRIMMGEHFLDRDAPVESLPCPGRTQL
jgi:hypothetical protein